ncbi:putative Nitrogen fixation protein FixH [Rhodospirillaceae bacterium LM-1]|nr:putative Nitrogen fixation protein FixH [Rhodospirillaceae bacterium LM-1]
MSKERKSGWWYPYIFVAGFMVVVAVNGVLIFSAVSTFSGLETENHYEKGNTYNRDIALARQQEALGWQVAAKVETIDRQVAGSQRRVSIFASFKDKDGKAIDGLAVRALLIRPTVAGHDVSVPMSPKGDGRYATETELAFHGLWDLRVVAIGEKDSYQLAERIQIP